MAVKIRLRRMGTRGKPFYRMVVADSRSPRNGRFIEKLGYYNPLTDPATVVIDEEKALFWLNRGAQPTDTAEALLKRENIFQKFLASKSGATAAAVEEPKAEAAPAPKKRTKAAEAVAEPVAETLEAEAVVEEQPTE